MNSRSEFNELHRALLDGYDLEELRTLCIELGVSYDDLRGEGLQGKARELILWLERRGQLYKLETLLADGNGRSSVPRPIGKRAKLTHGDTAMTARPTVFSLHGIRTRGAWQKDMQPILDEAGFRHVPLDFGFFRAISLIYPPTRRKQVEWFRDVYSTQVSGTQPPSIIAHSLGTYLVGTAMELYEGIVFDRIILCGSILRTEYPWSEVISSGARASQVLNDYGGKDIWASIVGWAVHDAGESGASGFRDLAGGKVLQRGHRGRRHSDYFYDGNYRVWTKFLKGESLPYLVQDPHRKGNWRFRTSCFVLILFVLALLAWLKTQVWP